MYYETIEQNINDKIYESKVEYPTIKRPMEPRINKDSEYYEAVRAEYEKKLDLYKEAFFDYRKSESDAKTRFRKDIIEMIKFRVKVTEDDVKNILNFESEKNTPNNYQDTLEFIDSLLNIFPKQVQKDQNPKPNW